YHALQAFPYLFTAHLEPQLCPPQKVTVPSQVARLPGIAPSHRSALKYDHPFPTPGSAPGQSPLRVRSWREWECDRRLSARACVLLGLPQPRSSRASASATENPSMFGIWASRITSG